MREVSAVCLVLISLFSVNAQQRKRVALTHAEVKAAERRLSDLGYWTGPVDGVLDEATRSALIAFQKWKGRPITGKLTREEFEAMRTALVPAPRDAGYQHVEVDVDRQVLMLVSEDGAIRV